MSAPHVGRRARPQVGTPCLRNVGHWVCYSAWEVHSCHDCALHCKQSHSRCHIGPVQWCRHQQNACPCDTPIDPSIAMGETKHGLIFKTNSVPIPGMSTKVVHHPGEHCSTLLPIQDGAPIQASGMQCKSPQVITYGLCGYLGVMMSWCFCHPIKFWSEYANPVMVWLLEVTHYVDGLVVPISCRQCLNHRIIGVSHWNVWRHLQPSSWFAAYPLSLLTMVDYAGYSLLN